MLNRCVRADAGEFMKRFLFAVFFLAFMAGCADTATVARVDGQERELSAQRAADQKLALRVDELSREMVDLKERLSLAEKEVSAMRAPQKPQIQSAEPPPPAKIQASTVESKPVEVDIPPPAPAKAPAAGGQQQAEAKPQTPVPQDEASASYATAFAAFRNGKYAKAILDFEDFLIKYSDHDYADDAQYWIGESYFSQGEYEQAIAEFSRLMDRFSLRARSADACLMIGESYDKLGQGEKARAFFSRVVKDYPNSEAARRAGYRLAPR